ncbi:ABC transporter ATP-binding protein [Acidaminobacter sp. JC074]|uniref:ABC transporter ATP-binding protein n=1 Tax=Acidaminobacter sp. JC074 TaxID=2530199 RepID=UPI001F111539|nr:ABC transporter ATP-binding protein [Acidaminobacter sp. JC074]MCH4888254.1 ABC transporter ATP-binding protein [Acidaminobacter sp. JC074]
MIKVDKVKKYFDDVKAVDGIDFEVEDGRFLGLLGPNGAGKTTTIRMMIGLLDPTEGQILYDGVPMGKDQIDIKMKIGVVSQHINLDKELTVEENMIFAGKLYHLKKDVIKVRIEELLGLLGLSDVRNRVTKKLSGGMKRKLMIAKALMHNPDYIFLDEPTVGIDVHARKEIWKFLRDYHKQGKTIILTTHYIEEAEQLCDWVLMVNRGKVFKENTSGNLIKEIGEFKIETDEDMYFFDSLDQAHAYSSQLKCIYNISKTSLEDVFYKYTKEVIKWKS